MAKAARILKMGYLEMKLPQKKGTWQLKWCIFCILDDNSTSFLDYFSNEESFRKGGKVASIRLDAKDKLSVTMDQKLKQNCLMVDNDKGPFGFYHKDPMQMAQWQKVFLFCLTPGEGVDMSQMGAGPGTPLPPLPPTGDSDGPPPVPPIPPGHPMNAPRLPGAPSPPPYPGNQPLPPALSGMPLPPLPTVSMSGPPLPPLPVSEHNYEEGVMSTMFKVAVEETIDSKRLGLAGEFFLVISPEEIVVMGRKHGKDGKVEEKEVLTWKLTTLRRFFMTVIPGEKSDQLLSIESGRRSSTGPGVFQFFTAEGDELYSCIRQCAIKGLEMIKARKAAMGGSRGQQQSALPPPQQAGPPGPRQPGPPGPRQPGPRQPGPPGPRQPGPPGPRQPGPPGPRQPGPPGPRQPGPPGPQQPRPPGPRQPGPPGPNQAGPGKAQAPQTAQGPPTTPRGPAPNNNQQQANANAPNQKAAAKQGQQAAEGTSPPKAPDKAEELKAKGVIIDDGMNPVYGQGLEPLPAEDEDDQNNKGKTDHIKPPMGHTRNASNISNLSFDLDPEFVAKANLVTANCKTEEDLDGLEQEFDLMKLLQSSVTTIEKDCYQGSK